MGHLLRQASFSVPHHPGLPIPGIAVTAVCLEFARAASWEHVWLGWWVCLAGRLLPKSGDSFLQVPASHSGHT